MKGIWAATVLVVLALWLGYDLGYHRGMRDERAAWKATEVAEVDSDDRPPMIWSKSSNRWLTDRVKNGGRGLQVSRHPPAKMIIGHDGPLPENRADPRNTLVQ